MTSRLLLLTFCSVAMSAVAQILLKVGMTSAVVQQKLANGSSLDGALAVAGSIPVIAGFALYGLGALVWLLVLSKVDVSQAYPFVALGFILTMLMGNLLLGEQLSGQRIAGTLLVIAGVALVART